MTEPKVGDVWEDVAGEFRITGIEGNDVFGVLKGGFTVRGLLSWFEDSQFARLIERDGRAVQS